MYRLLVDINDKKLNNSTSLNSEFFAERFELNADKKRMWIPAIGIKSIDTRIMNVSVPLNLGILSKSQL